MVENLEADFSHFSESDVGSVRRSVVLEEEEFFCRGTGLGSPQSMVDLLKKFCIVLSCYRVTSCEVIDQ